MWEVENALQEMVNYGVVHGAKLLLIFCGGSLWCREIRKVWVLGTYLLSVVYIIEVNRRFAIPCNPHTRAWGP